MDKQTVESKTWSPTEEATRQKIYDFYTPYLDPSSLGGLSDLEQNALNMLKGADVWSPLSTAGKGLLTGTTGPKTITPEESNAMYYGSVVAPAEYNWSRYGGTRDTLANELAGPSYLSRGKNIIADQYAELQNALATGKGGWEANIANINRAIEEAKAGRALSALSAVPSSMLGWASGVSGIGRSAQNILDQIVNPEVLRGLSLILGQGSTGGTSTTPYGVKDYLEMGGDALKMIGSLPL